MTEVLGIGIKLDIRNVDITIEKNKNILKIKNKREYSSEKYDLYKRNWRCKLNIGEKIKFIEGNDIYLYDFEYLNQKDKIFSRSEILYIGLNIRNEKEILLSGNKYYLLSPSSKIKIGKGKIGNDIEDIFVNEDTIVRDILRVTDGLLVRKPLEV
ncbi:MAG: hypothetical protein BXU00_01005 [Candidatus Nanoclepta minutus]|uniref:Uncharacterized protein n=1 Tax=Candidatus Nanoclepta minutus TaxID=1940235 RepID=A0A397WNK7_9ARCH|nr:MAG: hypothetical protein BXU00_01005 [Candidatus Nanoclepta minutus]